MVARHIIHHREVQVLILLNDVVVGHFIGSPPGARCNGSNTHFRTGLVVWRVTHDEELVPALGDELSELSELRDFGVRWPLGQDFPPQVRIAQPLAPLSDGKAFERLVARPHGKRIERGAYPHHHANWTTRNL